MILRLLILSVVIYLLLLLVTSIFSRNKRRGVFKQGPSEPGEEMVLDPQCQSYIPKGDALQREDHYFCSEECARNYLSREGRDA